MLSLTDPVLIHYQLVSIVGGPHDGESHPMVSGELRLELPNGDRPHRYYRDSCDATIVYCEVLVARMIGGAI